MARLKGLTHKELADKAELSQSTISSITNGGNGENVANPSLETMVKIASALDTDLTSLLKHHDLDIEALKNLGLDDTFYINNPKTESSQDFEIVTVILPKYKAFQAKKWEIEFLNSRLSNQVKK